MCSASTPNQDTEVTMSTIAAMQLQETSYCVCDAATIYEQQQQQDDHMNEANPLVMPVDLDCRDKMAAWSYQVVDFLKFHRETVSISMNYLDRYLATAAGDKVRADRRLYQLASMTCLYTAVKIHEPAAMAPKMVSSFSQRTYSPEEVEAMEQSIVMALQWRLNAPTAMAFCREFLNLIPAQPDLMSEDMRRAVLDICAYQTEIAVREHRFMTPKASTIAFCALLNALEFVGVFSPEELGQYSHLLSNVVLGEQCSDQDDAVLQVQRALRAAVTSLPDGTFVVPVVNKKKSQQLLFAEQQEAMKKQQRSCFHAVRRSFTAVSA